MAARHRQRVSKVVTHVPNKFSDSPKVKPLTHKVINVFPNGLHQQNKQRNKKWLKGANE